MKKSLALDSVRPAISGLVPQRLDVALRLPLARAFLEEKADQFAELAYREFLYCLNPNETFGENGQKYSFEDYLESFRALAESMKTNGFLTDLGTVPIGANGFISNGAHRVALGILLGLDLHFHLSETVSHPYDQHFLLSTGLSETFVDLGLLEVVRAIGDTRFLVLFDSHKQIREQLHNRLRKLGILWGRRDLSFQQTGQQRLIYELYGHNEWFRDELLDRLTLERMSGSDVQVSFFLLDTRGVEDFQNLKEQFRNEILGSQFPRKLHGTDGAQDTSNLAELIYSDGGRHFLRLSPPGAERRTMASISQSMLHKNGHLGNWAVSGSSIIEMHGGREAGDLDIVTSGNPPSKKVDSHETYLALKPFSIGDLLWNSNLSFVYRGIKFLNLPTIACTKIFIGGEKNIADVVDIASAVGKSMWAELPVMESQKKRRRRSRKMRLTALLEWYAKKLPYPVERFLRYSIRKGRIALGRLK